MSKAFELSEKLAAFEKSLFLKNMEQAEKDCQAVMKICTDVMIETAKVYVKAVNDNKDPGNSA